MIGSDRSRPTFARCAVAPAAPQHANLALLVFPRRRLADARLDPVRVVGVPLERLGERTTERGVFLVLLTRESERGLDDAKIAVVG